MEKKERCVGGMLNNNLADRKLAVALQSSALSNIKPEMKDVLDKGYFTLNNVPYNFNSDEWDFLDSLKDKDDVHDEHISFVFDFRSVRNSEYRTVLKLWTYWQILNQKCKIKTCRFKVNSLIKIYQFTVENKMESYFLNPKFFVVQAYFKEKSDFYYTYRVTIQRIWLEFLIFTEQGFHINQNLDALDSLKITDSKKLRACHLASIDEAISPEYFNRLYDFCQSALDDETMEATYRIICAALIIYSQTGLRRTELLATEVQEIQILKNDDVDDNKKISKSIEYFVAPITKNVSAKDTIIQWSKIPVNESVKRAFNFLVSFCNPFRLKIHSNRLIVLPRQWSKSLRSDTFRIRFMLMLIKYHRELDTFDTQDKYPELHTVEIGKLGASILKHTEIRQLNEKELRFVLVYPVIHQFRKTFGTTLHQVGQPVETISKLLHHYSTRITDDWYIKPYVNQKDMAVSQKAYNAVINQNAHILGKRSNSFIERLKERINNKEFSICKNSDELVELMSNNHPLHAKEVGFCLKSDLLPCTTRTDDEKILCAYNTCPNIGFMYYNLVEHYQKMLHYVQAISLNRKAGLVQATQKESNRLKYLLKTFLLPEIEETKNEIAKHGEKQIIEWYPEMKGILANFDGICESVRKKMEEGIA